MTRRHAAVAVLLLWTGGLCALAWREFGTTPEERLAKGAAEIDPATYYYAVYQGGTPVGAASSAIDTSHRRIRETDFFRGRLVIYGDTQSVEASSIAYLSRPFAMDSFTMAVGGDQRPFRVHGATRSHAVLLPSLLPIAFMLSGDPTVGRSASYWMYNPIGGTVQPVQMRIAAESLFTVSDSAMYDSATHAWVPAHSDTVRAWSIAPPTASLTVWVDAEGRLVSASEPGGLHLIRSAYEIAFTNRLTNRLANRRLRQR